jgi:hypothetical protein
MNNSRNYLNRFMRYLIFYIIFMIMFQRVVTQGAPTRRPSCWCHFTGGARTFWPYGGRAILCCTYFQKPCRIYIGIFFSVGQFTHTSKLSFLNMTKRLGSVINNTGQGEKFIENLDVTTRRKIKQWTY